MDGKKVSDENVTKSKIVYDGNKIQLVTPHQSGETIVSDVITITPKQKPQRIAFCPKKRSQCGQNDRRHL